MSTYVIELYLGVGRERLYLVDSIKGSGVTPQSRNATKFETLRAAAARLEQLLLLSNKDMAKLVRKESTYDIPVTIKVVLDSVPVRIETTARTNKFYTFDKKE